MGTETAYIFNKHVQNQYSLMLRYRSKRMNIYFIAELEKCKQPIYNVTLALQYPIHTHALGNINILKYYIFQVFNLEVFCCILK